MLSKDKHSENAFSAISFTEGGIVKVFKFEHLSKTISSILFKVLGSVAFTREEHPIKVPVGKTSKSAYISTFNKFSHLTKVCVPIFCID